MTACIIVPVYNHQHAIGKVIERLKPIGLHCFFINDGSTPECSATLQHIAEQQSEWVTLFEREKNGGKGAAVVDGFKLAIENGFSHAIQIDADGQHQFDDIKYFLEASEKHPERLILGQPIFDKSVPKKRLYGRKFTNLWIWIHTLSFDIADGMCGFRCYPLPAVALLLQTTELGQRMDFDIDIVVRLYWQGLDVVNIPTEVQYPIDGVSHFKMLEDNLMITKKHTLLFFGMLWRLPMLIMRKLK
jgi:glycosyltransferase involved in cell wall biosynthesis